MDVMKQYVDTLVKNINDRCNAQYETLQKVAVMFGECMENGGVVQLFGSNYGVEFCNELNYRAGGIAIFHAYRLADLSLRHFVTKEDIKPFGAAYNRPELVDEMEKLYELDNRDLYCVVSDRGNEPLVIELARRVKERGQKLVVFVNKKSYDMYNGSLLDYADLWVDMMADEPEVAVDVNGVGVGQTSSTVVNVMAQMLHAEVYKYFIEKKGEAPVLLSANVKGADVHNNALTDPYGKRVRG